MVCISRPRISTILVKTGLNYWVGMKREYERKSLLFDSCYGIGMPPIRTSWIRKLLHASATTVVGGLHPAYYALVIVGAGFYGNSPVWYAKNTWGKR